MQSDVMVAWRQLETVRRAGKTRSIGVSNFSTRGLEAILASCEVRSAAQDAFAPRPVVRALPLPS